MNATQIFAALALTAITGLYLWFWVWLMRGQYRIHKMHNTLIKEGREKELIYK